MASTSTPNARAFVQGQGARFHPGWDARNASYDPLSDSLIPNGDRRIKDAAKKQEEIFLRVMAELEKMTDYKPGDFDLRKRHNWQEVLTIANQSAERYKDRAKGIKGLFKRVGRGLGDINDAVEPVLGMLPSGEYTSIVCALNSCFEHSSAWRRFGARSLTP
ncbi:hypothetical protein BAUCODRAFT_29242 [Baudoinia panamericana UAMH 10762]|uniref:Uncharacterized protein n=1 Tax=Baudoinia panamericana (strain UAMH 10762) TaxID=717646 RepID=M2NNQ2_BAUPA|nr:uncharacterized protein BAUCODRAFT_29242 [Baudoinia panamericana UAMH 10762]EMD00861.1 hypothetical protein BAUCODRAFT_29242 [Baudoinia panamericana UAMH 10762]